MTRLQASKELVQAESVAAQFPTEENLAKVKAAREVYEKIKEADDANRANSKVR